MNVCYRNSEYTTFYTSSRITTFPSTAWSTHYKCSLHLPFTQNVQTAILFQYKEQYCCIYIWKKIVSIHIRVIPIHVFFTSSSSTMYAILGKSRVRHLPMACAIKLFFRESHFVKGRTPRTMVLGYGYILSNIEEDNRGGGCPVIT